MEKLRISCGVIGLTLMLAAVPAFAGPLEDGFAAYEAGQIDKALEFFRKAAATGDAEAQNALGLIYGAGRGVPQDYQQAMQWFAAAAKQGHPDATNNIGTLYLQGLGVPQSYAEAAKWLLSAANLGSPAAQYNLAGLFQNGQGVPADPVRAYVWYALAARYFADPADRKDAEGNRDLMAKSLDANQRATADQTVQSWRPKVPQ